MIKWLKILSSFRETRTTAGTTKARSVRSSRRRMRGRLMWKDAWHCSYLYIYIITRSFKDPKICRPSEKKLVFFEKKRVLVKSPYFGFWWICTKFVQIGWTCIKFLLITRSNFILTTCEICQTERAIETEASVIRHDARFLHRLQWPLCCELSLQRDWR